MEKSTDIEVKYQKLAAEFSKVRSQATVLKKAVLDEQAKNCQSNELIKIHEQTIRKHDQEMESLIFRNEQLTKRISVLQQELQVNNHDKKSKNKSSMENTYSADVSVLDEELQKKILENAQLVSSMSDKDVELSECKEKIQWLDDKISTLNKKIETIENCHRIEIEKMNRNQMKLENQISQSSVSTIQQNGNMNCDKELKFWKEEAERLKTECNLLRSKPNSNEQLTEYYEKQINEILELKLLAQSETKSLLAENVALKERLENLTLEHNKVEHSLERSYEELLTTNENYKLQLDAMTEHLASQNEKITKQCDEIQLLKHMLSIKK